MSLVTCTECGSTVSDKAAACPKCGAPQRASAGTLTHPTKHSSPMPLWLGMTILGVLMAGVLGGLVFYSKRADPGQRSTTAAAAPLPAAAPPAAAAVEQPAPAPVEQPRVPWADRADTAVTKMLSTDGATLAKGIKRIIHPMGPSDATLAGFDVRRAGSGLSVQLTISWSGGLGLGGYTTIVVWNFDRRHHGQATVYNDSSPFAAKNAAELDQYFRDQIYPSVMTSIGD